MIDLHSHLLPGVDDGSRSVAQSVGVLRAMAKEGLTGICLTPHLLASKAGEGVPARHDEAFAALKAAAPEEVTLYRGAEVMLDRPLPRSVAENRRVTLGGSRYILVEFPRLVAFETVTNALTLVVEIGLTPLLAHPERYSSCSPNAVYRWRQLGAAIQVDANTLLSPQPRGQRARQLLAAGLADVLAADNHGDIRGLGAIRRAMDAQGVGEQAGLLLTRNPAAILADEALTPVEPCDIKVSWRQRIRHLFEGEQP